MRRLSFQSQLTESVDGFSEWDIDAFLWGTWRSDELGDVEIERPPIAVVDTLRRKRFLSAEEFTYTRGRTDRIVKVTLPSPSLFANFWDPDRSTDAYDSAESFLGDVAEILREEVEELVRLGATYIQLDAPQYPLLIDPTYREFYERRGWPADRWIEFGTELDNHRDGRTRRRDVRLPSLPGEPDESVARLRRLRLAGRAAVPAHPRRPSAPGIRRRTVRLVRRALRRVRGHDGRPGPRDDEDRTGRDRRPAHGSHPARLRGSCRSNGWPCLPNAGSARRSAATRSRWSRSGRSFERSRRPRRRCGARRRDDRSGPGGPRSHPC